MKNTIIATIMIFMSSCGISESNTLAVSELRSIQNDAGLAPVSFQIEYSEFILNDEPIIYIPTFALAFDQTTDSYVDFNSSDLNSINDFTLEFWFNPTMVGTFENDSSCVVDTREFSQNEGFAFYWQEAASTFYFLSTNGSGGTSTSVFNETDINTDSNHVVVVTTGTGFDVFLNGVRVKQISYNGFDASENTPFRVAACVTQTTGAAYSHFVGIMDNFAFYDKELSSDEILQHYAIGSDLLER